MANICMYKIKVIGRKEACIAFMNMMPVFSDLKEISAEGTDDFFTLIFEGDCKWSIHYGTKRSRRRKPYSDKEIAAIHHGDGLEIPLADKAKFLLCEVFCNSMDIDDPYTLEFDHWGADGRVIYDNCPPELNLY